MKTQRDKRTPDSLNRKAEGSSYGCEKSGVFTFYERGTEAKVEQDKKSSDGTQVSVSRMRLIGEGQGPWAAFKGMPDKALWIFLEEPDPEKWLPEMKPLEKYLEE
jgi:hypothetical protein